MKNKLVSLALFVVMALSLCACQNNAEKVVSSSDVSSEITSSALSEGEISLAKALLYTLQEKETEKISFYYLKGTSALFVGYKPLADFKKYGKIKPFLDITDAQEIEDFKSNLNLTKWEISRPEKKSVPIMTVYISSDLHINLETLYDETCWISISSAQGNAYYKVPKKVYNNILSKYEE